MSVRFVYPAEFPRQPVLESELVSCEEELGFALPADFRAFLQSYDGPMPEPAWIRIERGGEPDWLGPVLTFFTVMRSDPRSRRDTIESYTYASRDIQKLPRHFICIGIMVRQPSTLLLSTAEEDHGTIYAWHVRFGRFDPSQLLVVAPGLAQLLDSFCEPPATAEASYPNWKHELERMRSTPPFPT
jgi:hypothetical protein